MTTTQPDFDLTDDELRATHMVKWALDAPGVQQAWVAEMDVRPCPAVHSALLAGVAAGALGYPSPGLEAEVASATAEFTAEFAHLQVPSEHIAVVGDVMTGVRVALQTLCEPGPVVVPVPTYGPFLSIVAATGRDLVPVPCVPLEGRAAALTMDCEGIDAALAAGARTVLIANPANPLGRAWSPAELSGLRDVVRRRGARVISDEVHAPLVLSGALHTPYAGLPGAGEHTTTIVAASKAFNTPGLKCAQLLAGSAVDAESLRGGVERFASHDFSTLGALATIAAYREGGPWLAGLQRHLDAQRSLLAELLAAQLPTLRWTPMEATYLAWVDASPTGLEDPSRVALEVGEVRVSAGDTFGGAAYRQFARINVATSAERLERIVAGLARAWT